MNNNETFSDDLAARLASVLPPEQLRDALHAVDQTVTDYEIQKKETGLTLISGLPPVVDLYLASKAVENLSDGSVYQYRQKLINFFQKICKPIDEITSNDIRMYLYDYKRDNQVSDSTLDGTRRVLNCFFGWLVLNDYLVRNPVAKLPKIKHQQKERTPLTSYELEELRWSCDDIRQKAIVDFLFSTGCRVSECVDVQLSDIDWTNRSVIIRHGKGDKYRKVFFNAESELTLRRYLATREDSTPYLFVSKRSPHVQLGTRAMQLIIKDARIRSQITNHCTPHTLRHTFATYGIHAGIPLEQLQALMGHAKPETTLIYAKLDTTDLQHTHQQIYA